MLVTELFPECLVLIVEQALAHVLELGCERHTAQITGRLDQYHNSRAEDKINSRRGL